MSEKEEISEIINSVREEGRTALTEYESKKVLSCWGIPVADSRLASDEIGAVNAARELKYPVVLKIVSPQITRKSEAGCVRVGLTSEIEVRQAFQDLVSNAKVYDEDADIHGVLVQEYIPESQEVVLGVIEDQSFGPTVTFSLGGVWTEVLEDVSFKLAPVSRKDAEEMVGEIDGYPILSEEGNGGPIAFDELYDMIQKMSELPLEYSRISEVDLDPVFVSEDLVTVIDARITLTNGMS